MSLVQLDQYNSTLIKVAIKMLKELQVDEDQEIAHIKADNILCNVLKALGQYELVNEFEKINKW